MEKPISGIAALSCALFLIHACAPASAQQIGEGCPATSNVATTKSNIAAQGAIECIPDSTGQFSWQPMGAGIARYDNSQSCSVPGMLRWNGVGIQYCNAFGAWQSIGGAVGALRGGANNYSCDPGYTLMTFQGTGSLGGGITTYYLCQQ